MKTDQEIADLAAKHAIECQSHGSSGNHYNDSFDSFFDGYKQAQRDDEADINLLGKRISDLLDEVDSLKSKLAEKDAEIERLRKEVALNLAARDVLQSHESMLVEALKDFKDFGTRHDPTPTGVFKECGCFQSWINDSWQSYIRSQDESVRERARNVLKKLGVE